MINRRQVISGASALLGTSVFSSDVSFADEYISPIDLELFFSANEDLGQFAPVSGYKQDWLEASLKLNSAGLDIRPPDRLSDADRRHLKGAEVSAEMEVNFENILAALSALRFDLQRLIDDGRKFVIGLRGCESSSAYGVSSSSIKICSQKVDYVEFRCMFVIVDCASKLLTPFEGSTVPDILSIYYAANGQYSANQMPTGRYKLSYGTHRSKAPKAAQQPGALLQSASMCVMRPKVNDKNAVKLDAFARWDLGETNYGMYGDNLHSALLDLSKSKPLYSSAGCQTIPGAYKPRGVSPIRAWKDFRATLGLPDLLEEADRFINPSVRTHTYILLTADEFLLRCKNIEADSVVLRFGCSGEDVEAFQKAYNEAAAKEGRRKLVVDGVFGFETQKAVIRRELELGGGATGIVVV